MSFFPMNFRQKIKTLLIRRRKIIKRKGVNHRNLLKIKRKQRMKVVRAKEEKRKKEKIKLLNQNIESRERVIKKKLRKMAANLRDMRRRNNSQRLLKNKKRSNSSSLKRENLFQPV
jgi:hypothetical protein